MIIQYMETVATYILKNKIVEISSFGFKDSICF